MSVHGVCFDEGQAGHCGLECRAHKYHECGIPDEIVEHILDSYTREDWVEFCKELLGVLRYHVLTNQSVFIVDAKEEAKIKFDQLTDYEKLDLLISLL